MFVTVQIDLAIDDDLLDRASLDDRVIALLKVYEAFSDDSYLDDIGQHLWNSSGYADLLMECCVDEIYEFSQIDHWTFQFMTDVPSASLLKLTFPIPKIISINSLRRTSHDSLIFTQR